MATGLSERLAVARQPGFVARLRRASWKGQRIDWSAYVFILPFFVSFLTFLVAPILFGGYVSLTEWGIVGEPKWIGFDNFVRAFADPWVPKIWANTLKYGLIVIPGVTVTGLLFALYVNQQRPGHTFARTAFYAPHVVSVTVIGLIWVWMLDTRFGLVNQYLGGLGVPDIPWLTNPSWVLFGVSLAAIWWEVGFCMVVLLAGLQDIPRELREAAAVDGANAWTTFWRVVLPLLRPARQSRHHHRGDRHAARVQLDLRDDERRTGWGVGLSDLVRLRDRLGQVSTGVCGRPFHDAVCHHRACHDRRVEADPRLPGLLDPNHGHSPLA